MMPGSRLIRIVGVLFIAFFVAAPYSQAAETVEVQVEREDGVYHIYFEILIDAPRDRVYEIMTDYANLQELSPGIVSSELLSGDAGGEARVDITLKPCVWVLCKTLRKVSTVTLNAYGAIVYTTVPESSDFKKGKEQVIVKESQIPGQTRVTYSARLVPDFFVPPLIGPWLMRKHIVQNLSVSNSRVEKLARQ
jgi:carbon monoxide dehydrogenase subunit G